MKKTSFLLSLFYASSSLAIPLNLNKDGEVRYSLNDTTRYSNATLTNKVEPLANSKVSISLSYQNGAYTIHDLKNKKAENGFSLILNSTEDVYLGSKKEKEDGKAPNFTFKRLNLVGTRTDKYATNFINYWIVTITADNNSYGFKKMSFYNHSQITFEKDIIFPLVASSPQKNCFFYNYGMSTFKGKLQFFQGTQPKTATFQYQAYKKSKLKNFGLIKCDKSIWLTGNIFIGEGGQLKADEGII